MGTSTTFKTLVIGLLTSLVAIYIFNNYLLFHVVCGFFLIYFAVAYEFKDFFAKYILTDQDITVSGLPKNSNHDLRRHLSYPVEVPNSWYMIADSDDLRDGRVIEVRALGLVFAVWRDGNGKPVCQEAFCIHMGANLAVGSRVVDGCIECPFHKWKFNGDGSVAEVPYLDNPKECHTSKKLKTFPCVDWCGLVCVYFHADDEKPAFELPQFIPQIFEAEGWRPHLKWNVGFQAMSCVDIVDQAGDHAHFHTLHSEFFIPWTLIPFPDWFKRLVPLAIRHSLTTWRGDDKEWVERVEATGWGCIDRHLLFFTDVAGLTWNKRTIDSTISETMEMFVGPALVVFNIPFTIGALKVLLATTPVEGGSFIRVRTWVDKRVQNNFLIRCVAYLISGISASQLAVDNEILTNKVRPKKPILQPFDGPYNRTNAWLKQFYSKGSSAPGGCTAFRHDW